MRISHRTTLLAICVLLGTTRVPATSAQSDDYRYERFRIPNPSPSGWEEIKKVVAEEEDLPSGQEPKPDDNIPMNLEKAMCGGWDMEQSVEGKIAVVTGVPGRYGLWNQNPESGMAWRVEQGGSKNDGMQFPKTAEEVWGLSTACRPSAPGEWAIETNNFVRYPPTFFCEHPCERPLGDIKPADLEDEEVMGCGKPLEEPRYSCGGPTKETRDDGGLCEHLNTKAWYRVYVKEDTYQKGACVIPGPDSKTDKADLESMTEAGWTVAAQWFYCCTDRKVTEGNVLADAHRNCKKCEGEAGGTDPMGCRDGEEIIVTTNSWPVKLGLTQNLGGDIVAGSIPDGTQEYISYYRQYDTASYERDAIGGAAEVPNEITSKEDIPVACYGMWKKPILPRVRRGEAVEYDAKIEKVENMWKSCVIDAYTGTNFQDMGPAQIGKGAYEQDRTSDHDEYVRCVEEAGDDEEKEKNCDEEHGPIIRMPEFEEEKDDEENPPVWYPNLGGGISLISDTGLEKKLGGNFTLALLHLDSAKQETTAQLSEEQPFSETSTLRAFDDTVTNESADDGNISILGIPIGGGDDEPSDRRTIVEWWQRQETNAHRLFTPPIVRLVLPAPWTADLEALDGFRVREPEGATANPPGRSPLTESIEVQLQAKEDLLGEVAAYLERSMLGEIREEEVPVVVPLGSPVELRATAVAWRTWATYQKDVRKKTPDPKAEELATKLDAYADQIEYTRLLRTHLTLYLASVLEERGNVNTIISDWMEQNIEEYKAFVSEKNVILALRQQWQQVQAEYWSLHDGSNMPWCRNDRYTTSIFSLLDPWMPGRPEFEQIRKDGTPNPNAEWGGNTLPDIAVQPWENVVLDFSTLDVKNGVTIIPVLRPIQIRIAESALARPQLVDDAPVIPTLPDLPALPNIASLIGGVGGGIDPDDTPENGALTVRSYIPSLREINDPFTMTSMLSQVGRIVTQMKQEYDKFWKSILMPVCGTPQAERICKASGDEENKKGCCITPDVAKDCLYPYSASKKPYNYACVHAENDLMERFTRIGARPGVLLKEDFESTGSLRNPAMEGWDTCPSDDWACQPLNSERRYPQEGWKITVSDEENPAEIMRGEMIRSTLIEPDVEDEDLFPYIMPRADITPSFDVPMPMDLSPVFQSSSSNSAS